MDTLRALEEALLGFAGCAVVISHDRWFLDRIATHILAFEGDSEVVWFEGNYPDYAADLKRRKGVDGRPAAPDPVQEAGAGRRTGGRRRDPVIPSEARDLADACKIPRFARDAPLTRCPPTRPSAAPLAPAILTAL